MLDGLVEPPRRASLSVRAVLGAGGLLAARLPGARERPAQLAMAEAVADALARDQPLVVEAGTGTGKTFAYLVPAILSGQRVVVSTATRALQDQLVEKDLPFLRDLLAPKGIDVKFSVMKGLGNYLCWRRLERALVDPASLAPRRAERLVALRKHAQAQEERLGRSDKDVAPGDAASFGLGDDDPIWGDVRSGPDTRVGASCMYHERCFVTRMKARAESAHIVVVNHHLFFADLALRTGEKQRWAAAIPDYDAVIFDEAHQIEGIASDFFGENRNEARFLRMIGDVEALGEVSERAARLCGSLAETGRGLFAALAELCRGPGRLPLTDTLIAGPLRAQFQRVYEASVLLSEDLATAAESHGDALLARKDDALLLARRLADFGRSMLRIATVAAGEGDERGSLAYVSQDPDGVAVGLFPIDVGPILRHRLFERVPATVLTSATLATGSADKPSFYYTRRRLGLPDGTRELSLPSPFDARSQALLYTPTDLPEPNAPDFDAQAAERILQLLRATKGGAFVLTTSMRALRSYAQHLEGHFDLLVQGRTPKQRMLDEFRRRKNAVLVGTKSFWEGVDVPGLALRLVILDKLPFPVPSDPLWAARAEALEAEGGNAFVELHLPHALLTLKQGFGRLLRREDDAGIVAVLDRRLGTKSYGKRLIAGLPPASRTQSMAEVELFARVRLWPHLRDA